MESYNQVDVTYAQLALPTSATTAPSTRGCGDQVIYSRLDPGRTRDRCNVVVNPNEHDEVEDGESEPKSWMPLLVSRHQQESTL